MNLCPAFSPAGLLPAAASMLAQVTLVSLITLLLMRSVARHRPAARHGLGLCALICILSSPAIACGVERAGHPFIRVPLLAPAPATGPLPLGSEADRPAASRTEGAGPDARAAVVVSNTAGGLLLLWMAGALALLCRAVGGWREVFRLRSDLQPVDSAGLEPVLREVREALGTASLPPVALSDRARVPMALGPTLPVIVLPRRLAEVLDDGQLRDVLIHECAHVREGHHAAGLLQQLALVLFWPHPLVHWLDHELGRAREEVCDNWVLRCATPPGYARTLLTVATAPALAAPVSDGVVFRTAGSSGGNRVLFPLPARLAWAGGALLARLRPRWRLEHRVAGLLDGRRERVTRCVSWKLAPLAAVFVAAGISISGTRVTRADVGPARPAPRAAAGAGASVPDAVSSNPPARAAARPAPARHRGPQPGTR